MRAAGAALAILAGLAGAHPGTGSAPPAAREVRLVMGTPAEVAAWGAPDAQAAVAAAFAALQRVDDEMTLWRPSPLTALNDSGGGPVSRELMAVIAHAVDVARDSGGAFDPTVEPLVRAAGGLDEPPRRLPPAARAALLARVGPDRVRIDPRAGTVHLRGGARLDLGGIAKGFAADGALQALRAAGARAGLVDLGGSSLAVFGRPAEVALSGPAGRASAPWGALRLQEAALSTSGPAEKGGHVLDPRHGRPARRVLAATVVAASAMEADALSTAVYVLGADEGLALVRRRRAHAIVLTREKGRRLLIATAGFARAHALQAAPGVEVRERP